MSPVINELLKAFKTVHPDLIPIEIFNYKNGYLVTAPHFIDEIDYSDPYYYVTYDYSEILPIDPNTEMFKALATDPIWKK